MTASPPWHTVANATPGALDWHVETAPLRFDLNPADWRRYRTLRLHLASARQTAARIDLEVLGPGDCVLGQVRFAVDWRGDNDMQLWLANLEPRVAADRYRDVRSLRLTCAEHGLWPTQLTAGPVQLSAAAPTWAVNESDTLIDMGWHYLGALASEWRTVPEHCLTPAGPAFRRSPQPMAAINREAEPIRVPGDMEDRGRASWLQFAYVQGAQPGRLTVERRFDLDVADQNEILAKVHWDRDALLTVTAIVDGGREIRLIDAEPPAEDLRTIGAALGGARRLDAVRLELVERTERHAEGREIGIGLFWLLLRRATPLDDAPVETVTVRLLPPGEPVPPDLKAAQRRVRQMRWDDGPPSATPIGDPLTDALPFGFYFRRDDLPALRRRALHGAGQAIFAAIRAEADRALATELVDRNQMGSAFGGGIGLPKGLRGAGMKVYAPLVALAHLITGEERYAVAARRWILRAARSDMWCGDSGGQVDRPQVGEVMWYNDSFTNWHPHGFCGYMDHPFLVAMVTYGLTVAYDMLYHCFNEAERREVEDALAAHGTYILYDKLRHSRDFYVHMNQGVLFALPLLMATAFLRNQDAVYAQMHGWARDFIREFGTSPWDAEGVFAEGPAYGAFTLRLYVEALPPLAACLGVPVSDVIPESLPALMDSMQHYRTTWRARPSFLFISDGGHEAWIPGEVLAFLANYLRHPVAQYFWDETYAANPPVSLVALTALGDGIPPRPPDLPPARVYRHQPMAFLRTGWRHGDTLLVLNNIRHVACHGHRDRASIILEHNGEQLLVDPGVVGYSDPNVAQYQDTFCHSTLTFSQRSQSGGTVPYDTAIAGFLTTSGERCPGLTGGIDWVIADATAVYPEAERYQRHVIYLRPGVFVLYDDVRARGPETIELNFTCLGPLTGSGDVFVSSTARNRLLVHTFADRPLAGRTSQWGTHWPDIPSYRLIRATAEPAPACGFLTVLAPYAAGAPAPQVQPLRAGNLLGVGITTPETEEFVLWRHAGRSLADWGLASDARAVVLRRSHGGAVLGAAMLDGTYLDLAGSGRILTGSGAGLVGMRNDLGV